MIASLTTAEEAAYALLRVHGFSAREAAALVALRRRYRRGELREVTVERKRLEFARWLCRSGRLNEGVGGGS